MKRILKYVKVLFVVLFIIFEEILWNKVGLPTYNSIKSLKIMDRFRDWVAKQDNEYIVLIIFLKPFVLMEGMSLLSLSAFASGAILAGITLYVIKLLLTIPVVIIFNAAREQLLSFFIIKYCYGMILKFKRSKTFKLVKLYTAKIKSEFGTFKDSYLDGDGELKEELSKMYKNIKKV